MTERRNDNIKKMDLLDAKTDPIEQSSIPYYSSIKTLDEFDTDELSSVIKAFQSKRYQKLSYDFEDIISAISERYESRYTEFIKELSKEQTHVISGQIKSLETVVKEKDKQLSNKLDRLSRQLKAVNEENSKLRNILSNKYSKKSLLSISASSSMAFLLSLVAWFDLGIHLMHPIISIMGLIGAISFFILSLWRKN